MIELKHRKPYWRHTKLQMALTLIPPMLLIIGLPLLAERLMRSRFLGFPLGYFLCAQGLLIVVFLFAAWFVGRQDTIDHWHGAHEDL